VDACADMRHMMGFVLKLRGYRVLEAEDGQAAIELAKQKCPDLILMDLQMPVHDGLSATRLLRRLDELCDAPVITVSSNSREGHLAALDAGCNEYLTKPIDFKRLDYLVSSLLAPV
jgi:CheY-like chemotaxis protein